MSAATHYPCIKCGRGIDSRYNFKTCTRCSIKPIAREKEKEQRRVSTIRRKSGQRLARLRARQRAHERKEDA